MRDLQEFEVMIYDYLKERRKHAEEADLLIDYKRVMATLHECMENAAVDFAADNDIDYEPVYR